MSMRMIIWIISIILFIIVALHCLNRSKFAFFSVEEYLDIGHGENVIKYKICMIPIWTSHKRNDEVKKYISRYHLRTESEILLYRHAKRFVLQGIEHVSGFPFRIELYLRSDKISEEHKKKLILFLQKKEIEAYMSLVEQLYNPPKDNGMRK